MESATTTTGKRKRSKGKNATLIVLLEEVRRYPAYNNKWMTMDNWVKLVNKHCSESYGGTVTKLRFGSMLAHCRRTASTAI